MYSAGRWRSTLREFKRFGSTCRTRKLSSKPTIPSSTSIIPGVKHMVPECLSPCTNLLAVGLWPLHSELQRYVSSSAGLGSMTDNPQQDTPVRRSALQQKRWLSIHEYLSANLLKTVSGNYRPVRRERLTLGDSMALACQREKSLVLRRKQRLLQSTLV